MKILAVDAYNMIHRARHGFIQGPNSTIFSFFRSLKAEIVRHEPDLVYLVLEGRPKHRFALNEDYKANRPKEIDEEFCRQKQAIIELSHFMPLIIARHKDYECDDVIGHICTEVHPSEDVIILSSDTDFIQLLERKNVSLWNPIKKKFIEKWRVDYLDWKSLKGDPTDNIPGIRGIGEKRAYMLCETPGALEEFLAANDARRETFNSAHLQIQFAPVHKDASAVDFYRGGFDEKFIKDAFTEYNFKSIIGNAWIKWKTTMEDLDDKLEQYAVLRTAS